MPDDIIEHIIASISKFGPYNEIEWMKILDEIHVIIQGNEDLFSTRFLSILSSLDEVTRKGHENLAVNHYRLTPVASRLECNSRY